MTCTFTGMRRIRGKIRPELKERSRRPAVALRVSEWVSFYAVHGYLPPGIISPDNMMVSGNHRLTAARKLKIGLPCVVAFWNGADWVATTQVRFVY